ncbi:MAG: 5-(carboxyamino)imidazole ribonucleotide synthase [Hyphomicrobium sp.]|nr:5-(carboxyamino)imidazole ribonucleotide synthase [Hyphomicrobium sp.]
MSGGTREALPPGATIGILGSGQLGRMLALAAANLGFKCHIYSDVPGPASDVSAASTIAPYDDLAALDRFAAAIDVATYEFENIPVATVAQLVERVPVRPGAKALEAAQDRINEKSLARGLGARTADFAAVDSQKMLDDALASFSLPAILKTRRFGYDGKGQAKVITRADGAAAWAQMRDARSILESFVAFKKEVSVIAARTEDGQFRAFDVTENEHRNHILHRSVAPARIKPETATEAMEIARRVAVALDYVGVFGLEFFVVEIDGREDLYVNEIAPRVHNSGHWTMDGAVTSQFEQHIRAVAGWPLGSTRLLAPAAEMVNLIGDDILAWDRIASEPGAKLHHYGKADVRPGRKMGHVNRLILDRPS